MEGKLRTDNEWENLSISLPSIARSATEGPPKGRENGGGETMDCPYCDHSMTKGFIWIASSEGGRLDWQAGETIRHGLLGKTADEHLLHDGLFGAPAKRAYRCSSCGALLTRLDDPADKPSDDTSENAACLSCGGTIPAGQTDCPDCGWTYAEQEVTATDPD